MSDPAPNRPSLLTEARLGVRGVFMLLAFRPGWAACFSPTNSGVIRSFAGVILAFPAFWFLIASANFYTAENPPAGGTDAALIAAGDMILIWARFWLLFPVVAYVLCRLLNLSDRFRGWLVVHNWTVFVLIHGQVAIWALYMAGIADARAVGGLLAFYQVARLFVHWRVAHGALGLPPGLAAAAAGVALVIDLIIAAALQ